MKKSMVLKNVLLSTRNMDDAFETSFETLFETSFETLFATVLAVHKHVVVSANSAS
jgi:hypothetical protein